MLRSALAALQSRNKREKKGTCSGGSSAKPLTAPSKFKLRLRKKEGGAIAAAAAVPQHSSPASSPASTFSLSSLLPMVFVARLSALAGSASQLLLLAAQVASLFVTFYVAVLRLALDFPLSLSVTIARNAAAVFLESRPVAALASKATSTLLPLVPARLLKLLLPASKPQPGCVFYECSLHHRRLRPRRHEFEYRVRMALLDLDAPPLWFSRKEANPKNKTHLSAAEAREAAGLPRSSKGPVWLLTMPPAAGYSQNPISVYYCYAEEEEEGRRSSAETLRMPPSRNAVAAVAEVTNTPWGSVARFSFSPHGDSVPKCLHVSPFMDMRNEWKLTAPGPGRRLSLSVAASHPELGNFFNATLVGQVDVKSRTRNRLAERSGDLKTFFNYAFGPQRVALWIYGHAAVLFFRKKLNVFGPPALGAGARAVEESGSGGSSKKRRGIGSLSSSSSSSSASFSSSRWHEWVAARDWPWRVGACGI